MSEQAGVQGDNFPVIKYPAVKDVGGVNVQLSYIASKQQLSQILGRQVDKVDVPERRIFKEVKRILGLNL